MNNLLSTRMHVSWKNACLLPLLLSPQYSHDMSFKSLSVFQACRTHGSMILSIQKASLFNIARHHCPYGQPDLCNHCSLDKGLNLKPCHKKAWHVSSENQPDLIMEVYSEITKWYMKVSLLILLFAGRCNEFYFPLQQGRQPNLNRFCTCHFSTKRYKL